MIVLVFFAGVMTDTSLRATTSRPKALSTVVLGTMLFVVIVGIAGRAVASMFQREAGASARAPVTVRLSGAMLGEILVLLLLVLYLRGRGRSLRDLGLRKTSPARGWILAAIFTGLYLWMTFAAVLRGHAALGEISVFHIYNSLAAGIVAGFVEEIFFRGFVMSELEWSRLGPAVQVIAAGLLFGIAHSGWGAFSGRVNWPALIGSVTATTILGLAFAIVYLASRRSLMPVIAGHLVMDVVIEPWLLLASTAAVMRQPH
jgi:membrane protease YdiL (CAAX protease family)